MVQRNRDSIVYKLFRRRRKPEQGVAEKLSTTPLFKEFSDRELCRLEQVLYLRIFKKGEYIFREGTPGYAFFVLIEGKIHLSREGQLGEEKPAGILNPGEMLGELVILCATDRKFSAQAAEDCELAVLFKHDFVELIRSYPETGVKILLSMTRLMGERYLDLLDSLGPEARPLKEKKLI